MVYGLEDIMATWQEPWTEIWSAGHGPDRSYCGIAETDDGYAVDVFQGDTCVASAVFEYRRDAERAADRMRRRYLRPATLTGASYTASHGPAFTH